MDFTIEIVNVCDEDTDLELRKLIQAAFKSNQLLPAGHLAANIQSNASQQSFFIAAKKDNAIIGCNAFLANDFTLNNRQYVGYQSCWTATHPTQQGKGVFVSLINEAKKILQQQNAGFIYGVANNNSHSIFTGSLGFTEIPAAITTIVRIPFLKAFYLTQKKINHTDVCFINEQQVKNHKALQFPSVVHSVSHNKSWAWGKLSKRTKLGVTFSVFDIGGFDMADESDLEFLIAEIFRLYNVSFIQVLSCATHSLTPLLKRWRPSKQNGFIFFGLNMPVFKHLNLMAGPIDVF